MKFRFHRRTYESSMSTTINVNTLKELKDLILDKFPMTRDTKDHQYLNEEIRSEPYEENRDDWDSHWVIVGDVCIGTSDGNIKNLP